MNEGDLPNLLADTSDVVFDIDSDGQILFANSAAAKASGYSPQELLNFNISQLIAPEFLQLLNSTLQAVLASASPAVSELQLSGTSGNRVWLRAKFRLLASKAPVAVRMVAQDDPHRPSGIASAPI